MFVGVARITLQISESGSLKDKRQILRKVTDRLKARFNVSVAEVADNDLWQKATIGLSVVGNDARHVNEQLDKAIHFVDEMYVAPVVARELEIVPFGQLGAARDVRPGEAEPSFEIPRGDRSLAEVEGIAWEDRHVRSPSGRPAGPVKPREPEVVTDDVRAKARALRNPREWEEEP